VKNCQPASFHHPLYLSQTIIFEMLMTDRVVRCLREHEWHVALLEVPYPIIIEDTRNLAHKFQWLLEIVEHRDRCHDLRLAISDFGAKPRRREKIGDDVNPRLIVF